MPNSQPPKSLTPSSEAAKEGSMTTQTVPFTPLLLCCLSVAGVRTHPPKSLTQSSEAAKERSMTNQCQSTALSLFAALLLEAAQRLGVRILPNS